MDNAHGARLGGAVRLIPPRSDRLQVCLSPSEKARLAEEARRGGYETLSDYVRAKTLGEHKDMVTPSNAGVVDAVLAAQRHAANSDADVTQKERSAWPAVVI